MTKPTHPAPDQFGFCRTIGHAWSRSWTLTRETGALTFRLACLNCPTERRDTINGRTGELIARSYAYPDGYLATGTGRTLTRQDYRREYVGWLLAHPTPDANVIDLRRRRGRRAS
jgi:hypothetical protein